MSSEPELERTMGHLGCSRVGRIRGEDVESVVIRKRIYWMHIKDNQDPHVSPPECTAMDSVNDPLPAELEAVTV